ncbi:hypothetical protein [Pseudomonas sp.]|uniref:hypothetical protein n=1 Tax=Pseudomonas sp. TaxID=306 RepID=UPI00333E9253
MEKVKVTGLKWFEGEIEGKKFNSGTCFVEERLNDLRGTAKGYASQPYKLANAAQAQALAKREMPLLCNVEFSRVTNGKGDSETIIVDIMPADAEAAPRADKKAA